jgi:probable rRNA maturation factor
VIDLDVIIEHEGWSSLGDPQVLARRAVEAAFAAASDRPRGDVAIGLLLTGDAAVRTLNRAFRGQDAPTNVLSFRAPDAQNLPEPRPLGDIALAYETLAREAQEEGKALADHAAHLVVHGTLHLLGYDHALEAQAEIMEALEVKALASLGLADPYRNMAV